MQVHGPASGPTGPSQSRLRWPGALRTQTGQERRRVGADFRRHAVHCTSGCSGAPSGRPPHPFLWAFCRKPLPSLAGSPTAARSEPFQASRGPETTGQNEVGGLAGPGMVHRCAPMPEMWRTDAHRVRHHEARRYRSYHRGIGLRAPTWLVRAGLTRSSCPAPSTRAHQSPGPAVEHAPVRASVLNSPSEPPDRRPSAAERRRRRQNRGNIAQNRVTRTSDIVKP